MAHGGGFCEKHGPFDPPHTTCPYCAREDAERRAYGPPRTVPAGAPPEGFVRRVVEPEPPDAHDDDLPGPDWALEGDIIVEPERKAGATELAPRDDPGLLEPDDAGGGPPLAWLVIKAPPELRGTILAIGANQVIGRAGDIQWDDARLSRQHARVTLEVPDDAPNGPPVFHLWPFGPANPVFINDKQIRGATPLHENDEIRLGGTLLVFKTLMD